MTAPSGQGDVMSRPFRIAACALGLAGAAVIFVSTGLAFLEFVLVGFMAVSLLFDVASLLRGKDDY